MAAPTVRVLFVGASVTAGFFASTREQTYLHLIVRSFERVGDWVSVATAAQGGATVLDARHWQLGVTSDLVVIQMGTNDYGNSVPLNEFTSGYQDMLRRIRGASPRAQMVCLGGWDDPNGLPNQVGLYAHQYNDVVERLCGGAGGAFVDISPLYTDPANHGPIGRQTFLGQADMFHPNDHGHQALAEAVLHVVHPSAFPNRGTVSDGNLGGLISDRDLGHTPPLSAS